MFFRIWFLLLATVVFAAQVPLPDADYLDNVKEYVQHNAEDAAAKYSADVQDELDDYDDEDDYEDDEEDDEDDEEDEEDDEEDEDDDNEEEEGDADRVPDMIINNS